MIVLSYFLVALKMTKPNDRLTTFVKLLLFIQTRRAHQGKNGLESYENSDISLLDGTEHTFEQLQKKIYVVGC